MAGLLNRLLGIDPSLPSPDLSLEFALQGVWTLPATTSGCYMGLGRGGEKMLDCSLLSSRSWDAQCSLETSHCQHRCQMT